MEANNIPYSIIVAVTSDGVIGIGGDMPYHIPTDLRHFKEVTMGHPVVMGRRTFESLPKGALPGRRNIVVTRNPEWTAPSVETARSLGEALAMCADSPLEPMIIGGGQIYAESIGGASKIFLTEIKATAPEGDTFFPEIDPNVWRELRRSEPVVDSKSGLTLEFVCLVRE